MLYSDHRQITSHILLFLLDLP